MPTPELDTKRLPRHVAIIMDGNGRWAERNGVARVQGHEAGAKSVRVAIESCRELGVRYLSLYAFSTENWRRSKMEVTALFTLLSKYIASEIQEIHANNIRITIMGRRDGLSKKVLKDLDYCEGLTKDNDALTVNVGINYGSRAEIVDAAQAMARDAKRGALKPDVIDEDTFAGYLYQPEIPDPDMLIRTSGEMRLSNFMLWQLSYAEIVLSSTLWPDFRRRHLVKSIVEYQSRQRRFGGR